MFQTAVWQKAWDDCFWHYVCKTIYLWSRKVLAPTVIAEICSLSFFMEIKCYYNQRSSVETDRENTIPQNLCIILKLNEAWPLKGLNHCLTTLRVFNTEKGLHHFLTTLKVFIIEKRLHRFLETLEGFNFDEWLYHILKTLKVFQSIYSVECWWTATSKDRLSYIYNQWTWPALSAQFHSISNIFPFWDQIFLEWGDWYLL